MSDHRFSSRCDVAAKVDWEGGIIAALDYGITAEEMPDDELQELWKKLEEGYHDLFPTVATVGDLLEDAKREGSSLECPA